MAKEHEEHHEEKAKPKKHLHAIRTEQAEDGTFVHHHTYKTKKENRNSERERENVATSATPEEAGQHVAEQFGMNQQEPEAEPGEDEGAPAAGGDPGAAAAPAATPAMPGQ
jgi:hypothetical protein